MKLLRSSYYMQGSLPGAVGVDAEDMVSALGGGAPWRKANFPFRFRLLHTAYHLPRHLLPPWTCSALTALAPASVPAAGSLNSPRSNTHWNSCCFLDVQPQKASLELTPAIRPRQDALVLSDSTRLPSLIGDPESLPWLPVADQMPFELLAYFPGPSQHVSSSDCNDYPTVSLPIPGIPAFIT